MLAVLGALFASGLITILKFIAAIKRAEPKVHMIFLETARESQSDTREPIPQHIG